jgi:hypothetical protein
VLSVEKVVYEDEHLIVLHRHLGDTLVVSFNERGYRSSTECWGSKVFLALGLSSLGYVSKKPNWFPISSVKKSLDKVEEILGMYSHRVSYGHSQGGYAAIRYASALKVDSVLSFCPQVSIDPDDLDNVDRRFKHYFTNKVEHRTIKAGDVQAHTDVYVFYDPSCRLDKYNVVKIAEAIPQINEIKVYGTDHSSVRPFANREAIGKLVDLASKGDTDGIRAFNLQRKRAWSERSTFLARSLSERKLDLAIKVLDGKHHLLSLESAQVIVHHLAAKARYHYLSKYAFEFANSSTERELKLIYAALLAADNIPGALILNTKFMVKNSGAALMSDELLPKVLSQEYPWLYFCEGWSSYEKWGVWAISERARIMIDWAKVPKSLSVIKIKYSQVIKNHLGVRILANTDGKPINPEMVTDEHVSLSRSGWLSEIEFHTDGLVCPAAQGLSKDTRYLGVTVSNPRHWL